MQEERKKVSEALLENDCFPAGMELFPAGDDEAWEFIKKVIDGCDYYILLIAGKYGSLTAEGISFTEREYDYAVEQSIPVIALLRKNHDEIPAGKSEMESTARDRLVAFREKLDRRN